MYKRPNLLRRLSEHLPPPTLPSHIYIYIYAYICIHIYTCIYTYI